MVVESPWCADVSNRIVRVESILEKTFTSTPIPLSPEVKSFLVPGWGQFAQKRTAPALFFSGVTAAALTGAILYTLQGNQAFKKYKNASSPDEALHYRHQTLSADRNRNICLISGAFVWGLNLLDVSVAEKRRHKTKASFR